MTEEKAYRRLRKYSRDELAHAMYRICEHDHVNLWLRRVTRLLDAERERERKLTTAKIETATILAKARAMRAELERKYGTGYISGASLADWQEYVGIRKRLASAIRRETMLQKEVDEHGKV